MRKEKRNNYFYNYEISLCIDDIIYYSNDITKFLKQQERHLPAYDCALDDFILCSLSINGNIRYIADYISYLETKLLELNPKVLDEYEEPEI